MGFLYLAIGALDAHIPAQYDDRNEANGTKVIYRAATVQSVA